MAQKSESRDLDKIIVRLPDGLRERIKIAASDNNRSMNAEIVATLEASYPSDPPIETVIEALDFAVARLTRDPSNAGMKRLIISGVDELKRRLDGDPGP